MFNPQSPTFIGGLGLASDESETITDLLPLMAESGGGFDYNRQIERLGAANSTAFDPSAQYDSSVFRMLAPAVFHSPAEGLIGDFSSYGTSSVFPAIFYDPTVGMNVNLEAGVYGGQVEMECRKRKGMMSRGLEEYGTQKNEKQRRERLGKKFEQLKSLIPNPTKPDRATIVSDTIDYIKDLLRTVDELKRSKNGRSKESSSVKSSMRSSWIQRRSKSTFIDVRTIEDEVYIKLEQRKRVDCSLIVSRVLDELQLELLHLSCGSVGDSHVFMISTKVRNRDIYEASQVYASSVARRFIEVMGG